MWFHFSFSPESYPSVGSIASEPPSQDRLIVYSFLAWDARVVVLSQTVPAVVQPSVESSDDPRQIVFHIDG